MACPFQLNRSYATWQICVASSQGRIPDLTRSYQSPQSPNFFAGPLTDLEQRWTSHRPNVSPIPSQPKLYHVANLGRIVSRQNSRPDTFVSKPTKLFSSSLGQSQAQGKAGPLTGPTVRGKSQLHHLTPIFPT
uniref:Uncharacterized protein n=1 Tax=Caenorhabditis japonica TaxID=281687 RepID=A0A8R1ECA7_CAEJA